jgi:hypothetical protein
MLRGARGGLLHSSRHRHPGRGLRQPRLARRAGLRRPPPSDGPCAAIGVDIGGTTDACFHHLRKRPPALPRVVLRNGGGRRGRRIAAVPLRRSGAGSAKRTGDSPRQCAGAGSPAICPVPALRISRRNDRTRTPRQCAPAPLGHERRLVAHIANHFMQFADLCPRRERCRNRLESRESRPIGFGAPLSENRGVPGSSPGLATVKTPTPSGFSASGLAFSRHGVGPRIGPRGPKSRSRAPEARMDADDSGRRVHDFRSVVRRIRVQCPCGRVPERGVNTSVVGDQPRKMPAGQASRERQRTERKDRHGAVAPRTMVGERRRR